MCKISLVTYTRAGELFTDALDDIAKAVYGLYGREFKMIVCCEQTIKLPKRDYEIQMVKISGTKYRRLINVMDNDNSEYYLSVDNDITADIANLKIFIKEMIDNNIDVGWGKIKANHPSGFISKLVAVDKELSHNIIRPSLWCTNYGISIPGQVFCIKGSTFRTKLINLDTFLDDLALGLYVNINNCSKYRTNNVLGYELPNSTFFGLWTQRERWGIGYASILKAVKFIPEYRIRIIIHGLCYHVTWLLNWILIYNFSVYSILFGFLYYIIVSFIISGFRLDLLIYSLAYQVVFPLFHIIWGLSVIKELMKKGDS